MGVDTKGSHDMSHKYHWIVLHYPLEYPLAVMHWQVSYIMICFPGWQLSIGSYFKKTPSPSEPLCRMLGSTSHPALAALVALVPPTHPTPFELVAQTLSTSQQWIALNWLVLSAHPILVALVSFVLPTRPHLLYGWHFRFWSQLGNFQMPTMAIPTPPQQTTSRLIPPNGKLQRQHQGSIVK